MKQVPELGKIANIDTEVLFSEYSENLQPDHWTKIAEKLDSLANSDYKGILIAHGTDTMHYTSSFLSFALAGFPIPVALVGSQRSSDRPSSDAAINLIAASNFLLNLIPRVFFLLCTIMIMIKLLHAMREPGLEKIIRVSVEHLRQWEATLHS